MRSLLQMTIDVFFDALTQLMTFSCYNIIAQCTMTCVIDMIDRAVAK